MRQVWTTNLRSRPCDAVGLEGARDNALDERGECERLVVHLHPLLVHLATGEEVKGVGLILFRYLESICIMKDNEII